MKQANFIQPNHRKNEILGFLGKPLNDLCISRPKSRLNWGVELPFDSKYVTYVWFDALINYISALGYDENHGASRDWWPASYHLIGKDILTTHAVYWPTMLMSAGINLPESIFAHGWWLMSDSKMSKSIGNVVDPINLIDDYGVDPVRYYLMREMVLGQDANFTTELFKSRYNSELANDFGNLLSRITTLINKNFSGKIPNPGNLDFSEMKIKKDSISLCLSFDVSMKSMRLNEAIELVMRFISSVNKYMEQNAPWKLVKEDKDTAGKILYTAGEALRISALLLSPIMPKKTKDILDILNAFDSKEKWGGLEPGAKLKDHNPLFPRIK